MGKEVRYEIKIFAASLMFMLAFPIVIAALPDFISDKYYELNLHYYNGSISFNNVAVRQGTFSAVGSGTGYKAKLISFDERVLLTLRFAIPLEIAIDNIDPNSGEISGGVTKLEATDFIIRVPYVINGKTIDIYDPNNTKVLSVDVGYFAQVCQDDICEPHESYENCPQDCPSGQKDDYCDEIRDGICDPDCAVGDRDCEAKKVNILALTAVITIFLIIIFFGYLEFSRIRYQKTLKEKREIQSLLKLKMYITTNLRRGYTAEQIRNELLKDGWSEEMVDRAFQSLKKQNE